MGCVQSNNYIKNPLKNNNIANSIEVASQQDSSNKQNKYSKVKAYANLDQKHKIILNQALTSALKYFQSQQSKIVKEQQKNMISALNRYYQKNKNKGSFIDTENMLQNDFQIILRTMKNHHFFKQLFEFKENNYFQNFLMSIKKRTFKYKQYVYKQFDASSKFYIIGQGKLALQLHSIGLKNLGSGEYFGLQSIIYNSQQIQSVKVRSIKAILYEIDKKYILDLRQKISYKNKDQMRKLFEEKVIFFNFLNNKQKQKLMRQTVKSIYSKCDVIFEKDYQSTSFYIIKKGAVLIKVPTKQNIILTNGSFGQSAFYEYKSQRKGTAIVHQNDTIIYAIGSRPIFDSLGQKLDCAVLHNLQKWAMYRDPHINGLYLTYKFQMGHLLNIFQIKKGQKYQSLATKDQDAYKIFVNLTCKVNYQNDICVFNSKSIKFYIDKYFDNKANQMKKQRILNMLKRAKQQEDFFKINQLEEQYARLISKLKQEQLMAKIPKYQNDIVLTTKGTYAQGNVKKIVNFIIKSIEQPNLMRSINLKVDLSVKNIKSYIIINQKNQRSTYLAVQKNFGIQHILKIYHKKNKNKFNSNVKTLQAIKSLNKVQQFNENNENKSTFIQQNIKQACEHSKIISSLIHPNICGFYKAQEDQDNIYIILQYIKGITLLQLQIQLGIVPQTVIKYYLLKLSLILDYLHSQNIIYRDLKPQNILIDNKGYPNLFDFKTAKRLKSQNGLKTSTIIGTPHYMAPEIIQNLQYTFNVDYWQLGIILYELIYQKYPFANDQQDPVQIFKQILKKQPKLKKQNSNQIIKNLLEKNPENRIKNFKQLVKEKYLESFEYQQVQKNQMKPSFIPKSISRRFDNLPFLSRTQ